MLKVTIGSQVAVLRGALKHTIGLVEKDNPKDPYHFFVRTDKGKLIGAFLDNLKVVDDKEAQEIRDLAHNESQYEYVMTQRKDQERAVYEANKGVITFEEMSKWPNERVKYEYDQIFFPDNHDEPADYMVFIPKGADHFVVGHIETMSEVGLGAPHEIEVFYGSKDQCVKFVEDVDFNNIHVMVYHDINLNPQIVTPSDFAAFELGSVAKIVFTGNYLEATAEVRKYFIAHEVEEVEDPDLPF